ncbi:DUF4186 family protein [Nocardioides sp. NPDC127503]|uniref:DUF4186 family protein n=1 Tax=Nocardioides sp. NPDC127503 TaxID=3154516 RepID=UPI0033313805
MSAYPFDPDLIEQLRQKIASKHEELSSGPAPPGMVPLKIVCTMTSCNHGRHCLDHLRRPHKYSGEVAPGNCRDCGAPVTTMPGAGDLRYGDPDQLASTLESQQHELIRAHYWHVPIDEWAYNQALRLGKTELLHRIEKAVVAAMTSTDAWAGRAAPYTKNIVAYAQHATATCCRNCGAYWHGISRDQSVAPTTEQLNHTVWAAQAWLNIRLPDLPEFGREVPAIRRANLPGTDRVSMIDDQVMDKLTAGTDPTGLVVPDDTHLSITAARGSLVVARMINIDR